MIKLKNNIAQMNNKLKQIKITISFVVILKCLKGNVTLVSSKWLALFNGTLTMQISSDKTNRTKNGVSASHPLKLSFTGIHFIIIYDNSKTSSLPRFARRALLRTKCRYIHYVPQKVIYVQVFIIIIIR